MKSNQFFNFINWYRESKEENGSNYIKNNFNGDEEQFTISLIDYGIQYAISFGYNPFEVKKNEINNFIITMKENLYSKDIKTPFHAYSKSINNHMPRAILGKDNYLKYLSLIKVQEDYDPMVINTVDINPKEICQSYSKEDLKNNFFFRLTTQDRFYDFLYFPVSVLKKIFYKLPAERKFFDEWINNQINSIKFHTENKIVEFTELETLQLMNGKVYIKTADNKTHKLYSQIAGSNSHKEITTKALQNLVIDHIEPFEKVLFNLKNELRILRGIHYLLIKKNDGYEISNRNDLVSPGNLLVETIKFSEQNLSDLKNELNLIASMLHLQILDKKENLIKKKYD